MSMRCHDHKAISLCAAHHNALHGLTGPFKGWGRERLQDWERSQITATRMKFLCERIAVSIGDDVMDGDVF
jgi:hypothetical protein